MRWLWIMALLLGAVEAGAEQLTSPPSFQIMITGIVESDGELVATITDNKGKRVTTQCERDMREAMQAMERFLPFEDRHGLVNIVPTTALKAYHKALDQWTAAKACWGEQGRP